MFCIVQAWRWDLVRTVIMLVICQGCIEYEPVGRTEVVGISNPRPLATPTHVDRLVQTEVPQVDILWIVDNSSSMAEEQAGLAENFPVFLDFFLGSGLDYHIGVVSTDMEDPAHSGRLRSVDGHLWIEPDTVNPDEVFTAMAAMGTEGSGEERGLDTSYGALAILGDSANDGFYRDEAMLHVVVISDEEDRSTITPPEYAAWLKGLKPPEVEVTFSSIVSPDPVCPGANDPGVEYLEVTAAVGGIVWPICSEDWGAVLEQLGIQAAGLRREFFLSHLPVPGTIVVTVVEEGVTFAFEEDVDWVYDAVRNSVVFHAYVPNDLAEVFVTYELLEAQE